MKTTRDMSRMPPFGVQRVTDSKSKKVRTFFNTPIQPTIYDMESQKKYEPPDKWVQPREQRLAQLNALKRKLT